jgi:hypothetical protein
MRCNGKCPYFLFKSHSGINDIAWLKTRQVQGSVPCLLIFLQLYIGRNGFGSAVQQFLCRGTG